MRRKTAINKKTTAKLYAVIIGMKSSCLRIAVTKSLRWPSMCEFSCSYCAAAGNISHAISKVRSLSFSKLSNLASCEDETLEVDIKINKGRNFKLDVCQSRGKSFFSRGHHLAMPFYDGGDKGSTVFENDGSLTKDGLLFNLSQIELVSFKPSGNGREKSSY
ncbi:hypothetical protein NL676_030471 [Syzygium grande]|nr:hypothetical protein NL676_030471 [Syzygium grande]